MEAQFFGKQVGDYVVRQRRGQSLAFGKGWYIQVSHHDAIDALLEGFDKRYQFDTVEARTGEVEHRQCLVRIDIGIAMTWEMLDHSHYPTVLQTFAVGHHLFSHPMWVFAKRAYVNDGVVGVDIYIGHRGEIDGDAHEATLARHLLAVFIEQVEVGDIAQDAVFGEYGRG